MVICHLSFVICPLSFVLCHWSLSNEMTNYLLMVQRKWIDS
ncbi:hypothetical protein FDUTEX481_08120 [Tolypothrix sp. PCC 7601]|nr:hypothetical protein FDUTEX481_08120 [Tolypothrix sp. PCC 7601]